MQFEYEAGTFGKLRVDGEVALHLQRHLTADGELEAIALREVEDFEEGFEHIVALFLRDRIARIAHQELVGLRTTLLILQRDGAFLVDMLHSIVEQMEQNVADILLIEGGTHLGSVDFQRHVGWYLTTNLISQSFAEGLQLYILHLDRLADGILELRELLHMVGKAEQGFHLRLTLVELLQRGLQLG